MKYLFAIILIGVALTLNTCGQIEGQATSTSPWRTWTAPSDNSGLVAQYDMRYVKDTLDDWDTWFEILDEPVPSPPGMLESLYVNVPEGAWYFGIKSRDVCFNWSERSNIVLVSIDTTPPTTITDLE